MLDYRSIGRTVGQAIADKNNKERTGIFVAGPKV
jgi:hypothetical protein